MLNIRGFGSVQKSPSSKAAAFLTRGAYSQYVSTAKRRERRWRLFSTFPNEYLVWVQRMTKWDWAILAAFIIYALYAGFRERVQASQNLDEYFLAGRSLSGWKAGLSMAATQFAADTPLLVTGLVATAGIFALWRLWI